MAFGHPLLALESFIDPQRFRGTCYQAAGWERLGPTQGFQRTYKDFYTDTEHPKELWVRAFSPAALAQLRAAELPAVLRLDKPAPPPPCPVPTEKLDSLWSHFREGIVDPRKPRGIRHPLQPCSRLPAWRWPAVVTARRPSRNLPKASITTNAGACGAGPGRVTSISMMSPAKTPSAANSKPSPRSPWCGVWSRG